MKRNVIGPYRSSTINSIIAYYLLEALKYLKLSIASINIIVYLGSIRYEIEKKNELDCFEPQFLAFNILTSFFLDFLILFYLVNWVKLGL